MIRLSMSFPYDTSKWMDLKSRPPLGGDRFALGRHARRPIPGRKLRNARIPVSSLAAVGSGARAF